MSLDNYLAYKFYFIGKPFKILRMPQTAKKKSAGSRSDSSSSSRSKSSSSSKGNSSRESASGQKQGRSEMLDKSFYDSLKDIYWAEKHLTKALPKLSKAATNEELKAALDE